MSGIQRNIFLTFCPIDSEINLHNEKNMSAKFFLNFEKIWFLYSLLFPNKRFQFGVLMTQIDDSNNVDEDKAKLESNLVFYVMIYKKIISKNFANFAEFCAFVKNAKFCDIYNFFCIKFACILFFIDWSVDKKAKTQTFNFKI